MKTIYLEAFKETEDLNIESGATILLTSYHFKSVGNVPTTQLDSIYNKIYGHCRIYGQRGGYLSIGGLRETFHKNLSLQEICNKMNEMLEAINLDVCIEMDGNIYINDNIDPAFTN